MEGAVRLDQEVSMFVWLVPLSAVAAPVWVPVGAPTALTQSVREGTCPDWGCGSNGTLKPQEEQSIQKAAVQQNLTTLRNRVMM